MPFPGGVRGAVSTTPSGVDAHEIRRQRTVRATDSQWERVGALARAAGMKLSDFLLWRALESPRAAAPPPSELPELVRDRVCKAALVLWELERRRLADAGDSELWDTVTEAVHEWFEKERQIG